MSRHVRVGGRRLALALLALTTLASACGGTARHPVGGPATTHSSHSSHAGTASTSNSTRSEHSRRVSKAHLTFTLVVKTDAGDLPAQVAPISVASRQLVDPPHKTPRQWNTAAWIVQAAYPAVPSTGTTYIYGHACHHHICPFTDLKQAELGDSVIVTTPAARLTYLIQRIGLSPKSANSLPTWASDSTVKDRLVLVTCEFEHGDTSTNNILILAELSSYTPRHS